MLKNNEKGICIQFINNSEILSNCYYEQVLNIIEAFEILRDLIVGYNNSGLVNLDNDNLIAIKLFENSFDENSKFKAKLRESSLEDAKIDFNDEFIEDEEVDGLIGINSSDIELNELSASVIINIFIDERKIMVENFEYKKKFFEQYQDENIGIEFDDLDEFEYDLFSFNFFDLEDIVEFMEEHNAFSDIDKKFFRVPFDEKFLYSFTM